jgi:hypothetical protein
LESNLKTQRRQTVIDLPPLCLVAVVGFMEVPEKLYPGQNDSGASIKNEMSS